MKNFSMILISLLICLFSTHASAKGLFFSANIGATFLEDATITDSTVPGVALDFELDTGYALSMAFGYGFLDNARVEAELLYSSSDLDRAVYGGNGVALEGNFTTLALMANWYWDMKNSTRFTPFITVGLGFAKVEADDLSIPSAGVSSPGDDDNVFAYQLGAGLTYTVTETTFLDFKYRYFATEDPEFGTVKAEIASHNLFLGMRWEF